jgi:hypothetical protein
MSDRPDREPARDPQDLERLLIARQWVGDIEGMAALFESNAVLDSGEGHLTIGSTIMPRRSPKMPPMTASSSSWVTSAPAPRSRRPRSIISTTS